MDKVYNRGYDEADGNGAQFIILPDQCPGDLSDREKGAYAWGHNQAIVDRMAGK